MTVLQTCKNYPKFVHEHDENYGCMLPSFGELMGVLMAAGVYDTHKCFHKHFTILEERICEGYLREQACASLLEDSLIKK